MSGKFFQTLATTFAVKRILTVPIPTALSKQENRTMTLALVS